MLCMGFSGVQHHKLKPGYHYFLLYIHNYRAVARLIVLVAKASPKTAPTCLMTFGTRNLDIWSQRRFLSSKVAFTS